MRVLQQAVAGILAASGWSVTSEGAIVLGTRDGAELILAFLRRGEATAFLEAREGSSATLAAVLLEETSPDEAEALEAAGVACYSREEAEEAVLAAWLGRGGTSELARFLARD